MIILQAAPGGGMDMSIIFLMMGIFLVIQFVIIGPKQKKREKAMQSYLDSLSNGAKIITNSGIHGKFLKVEDNAMIVEVDTGVKLRMDKSALNYEATKALNPNT
jgi:preprotein translocase subunit YajC